MEQFRIGVGYDVHRLVEGRPLVLGGVTIPSERGLLGHSDADALLHAIMDALLGAAAMGDIGKHFPDTDPRYKDNSSLILLRHVGDLLKHHRFGVVNIDATLILEQPRIAPHVDAMRTNVAETLEIATEHVSVKATSQEGLGFIGAGEGIAAHVVVLLVQQ